MISRRKFLTIIGGGAVLAATTGGLWAATRDPARARRPWETAGQDGGDPRRTALSYAILAPNPHNRQPWLADLSEPDQITLTCDAERRLPATDPFDRQITIGLGCFLELLDQAAAQGGYRTDVTLFPEGEPQPRLDGRPIARIRLREDSTVVDDPLFAHVLARRSNKQPYDTTLPVETGLLAEIAAAARTNAIAQTNDPVQVERLRTQAWEAMHLELSTPATARESVELLRIGRTEIEANPDGIDLAGAKIEALAMAGLVSRDAMLDVTSSTFKQQLEVLRVAFDTAMAFMWLTTPGNSRADQIRAGRDYVRLNLAATGLGIAMHPLSQALQEFPEMTPHYDAMRNTLGIDEADTLQMFVRLGYGPTPKASPRWSYETRIATT